MPDPALLRAFQFLVWSYKQGEMVSLMIHLGDRLGLYRALARAGSVTPTELATTTGLHERWLLEWLRGQAAARLLEHDAGRFRLTEEGVAVLADEEGSLEFAAGAFGARIAPELIDRLVDAFRTGVGVSYEDRGAEAVHSTERMLGPWSRLALIPVVLPALDGVAEKLESGARVCDVGCGAGVALLTLAAAFPKSEFYGVDPSRHAIERAEARRADDGLANVAFEHARGEDLVPRDYDLVMTLDCMHDMTRPDLVAQAIRAAVADDGTWLIQDIRCAGAFEENLNNPMLALLYGFSVSSCMSSALSEPGGLGLGTVGFPPETAEAMARAAGFTRFRVHDFESPANLFYEVRP